MVLPWTLGLAMATMIRGMCDVMKRISSVRIPLSELVLTFTMVYSLFFSKLKFVMDLFGILYIVIT